MTHINRIQSINYKYHQKHSQSDYLPQSDYRQPPKRQLIIDNQSIHHHTSSQNPRYINSLVSAPIKSYIVDANRNSKHQPATQAITRSRVIVTNNYPQNQPTPSQTKVYQVAESNFEGAQRKSTEEKHFRKSHQRPIQVSRTVQQNINVPSPPRIGQRTIVDDDSTGRMQNNCCKRCLPLTQCLSCKCCSWKLCLLISCLIFVPFVGFIIYSRYYSQYRNETNLFQQVFGSRGYPQNDITNPFNNNLNPQIPPTFGNPSISTDHPIIPPINNSPISNLNTNSMSPLVNSRCSPGFFLYGSKCLSCPTPSFWNGTNCIKYIIQRNHKSPQILTNQTANLGNKTEINKNTTTKSFQEDSDQQSNFNPSQ